MSRINIGMFVASNKQDSDNVNLVWHFIISWAVANGWTGNKVWTLGFGGLEDKRNPRWGAMLWKFL